MNCRDAVDPKPNAQQAASTTDRQVRSVIHYSPPTDEGYVGSESCISCHREISDAYKSHPMYRSIQRIGDNPALAAAQAKNTHLSGKQRVFDVEIQPDSMVHHERMYDVSGELIYDFPVEMDYVVGSGNRARAYLYQRGNALFMSPLNWYSQSEKWDLAPGYLLDDQRRFDRRITEECLSCHAGRVAVEFRSGNLVQNPAFHEMSIGCEKCHGPGEQHVRRYSSNKLQEIAESIVNPASLDSDQREAICNQCHLQAAARIVRPGRSDLDFRPGQRLDDIWSILDVEHPISEDGKTHSVNHVQQMRESRCYSQSAGRFGCTSCHDPHRIPSPSERDQFYRRKCFNCHTEKSCTEADDTRKQQADSCIACHLPARKSSNISHVTQTDHRVKRVKDDVHEGSVSRDDETLKFFDNENLRLSVAERNRAMGLAAWKHLSKMGKRPPIELAKFLDQALQRLPDDGLMLIALGSIAKDLKQWERAKNYFERARSHPDKAEHALTGLVEIYYQFKDWNNAIDCADQLIKLNPQLAMPHVLRSDSLKLTGRLAEGINDAVRALELDPTLIPVREWLVNAYRDIGNEAEQKRHESIMLRMKDARPPAVTPNENDHESNEKMSHER